MNYLIVFFPTIMAYMFSKKQTYLGLKMGFIFLFFISALRFDYGNDYIGYYKKFSLISDKGILLEELKGLEYGYLLLNKIFSRLDFNIMLSVLAFFSCLSYYYIIKRYVKKKIIWMAVLFYLINVDLYFIQLSAIRQTIAINLFMLSIPYLNSRKFIKYSIFILCASLFHKSSILLLPAYIFLNDKKNSIKILEIINIFSLIIVFYPEIILKLLRSLLVIVFPKYLYYLDNIVSIKINSGLGIILNILILFLLPFLINLGDRRIRIFIKILYLQYLIMILGLTFSMFMRIGMYFSIGYIIVIPYFINKMKNKKNRIIIFSIITIFFAHTFFKFFRSPIYYKKFGNYKTVIFNEY